MGRGNEILSLVLVKSLSERDENRKSYDRSLSPICQSRKGGFVHVRRRFYADGDPVICFHEYFKTKTFLHLTLTFPFAEFDQDAHIRQHTVCEPRRFERLKL